MLNRIKHHFIVKNYLYECISILVFSHILFFPDSVKYLIYDNIDSNLVWYKNLSEDGMMFSTSNANIENLVL